MKRKQRFDVPITMGDTGVTAINGTEMLEPDVQATEEFRKIHRRTGSYDGGPIMRLFRASLVSAAIDMNRVGEGGREYVAKTRKHRKETREWILSRENDALFSFENVCEVLKLNPDAVRRVLLHHPETILRLNLHVAGIEGKPLGESTLRHKREAVDPA